MEKIYPPAHFDCTEKITDLHDYFNFYSELRKFTNEEEIDCSNEELILNKFTSLLDPSTINLQQQQIPQDLCSIGDLSVAGELSQLEVFTSNKYTMRLIQKEDTLPENASKLETVKAKMKYEHYFPKQRELDNVFLKPTKSANRDLGLENILVSVRIYQPFSSLMRKGNGRKVDRLKCSHEIIALASNKLSELRDKILCVNDTGLSLEIDDLKLNAMKNVKDVYPSGLIGINDALYIDMRHEDAIDYSEVIKKWGKDKQVADFKVFSMDDVCIKNLSIRIGYPYIYQHRGNCEHIIVFSDFRLIKRSDSLCSADYPYYRNINRYNIEKCNICHATTAKWVCCESDRLPYDRAYLCQECFVSYNYIGDEKVGTFKAYPYYNKSIVI